MVWNALRPRLPANARFLKALRTLMRIEWAHVNRVLVAGQQALLF
ncbi:MAG: hypothetical protein ACTSWE_02590 [Promethearchaeota archaeon]